MSGAASEPGLSRQQQNVVSANILKATNDIMHVLTVTPMG